MQLTHSGQLLFGRRRDFQVNPLILQPGIEAIELYPDDSSDLMS